MSYGQLKWCTYYTLERTVCVSFIFITLRSFHSLAFAIFIVYQSYEIRNTPMRLVYKSIANKDAVQSILIIIEAYRVTVINEPAFCSTLSATLAAVLSPLTNFSNFDTESRSYLKLVSTTFSTLHIAFILASVVLQTELEKDKTHEKTPGIQRKCKAYGLPEQLNFFNVTDENEYKTNNIVLSAWNVDTIIFFISLELGES